MPIDPKTWTREEIKRHSVDMRQFMDFRQSTLPNGMRIIEAYNSSGLTFTILPDRGLDIWTAHYKGIPLTWISQGSPHPPDFGQTWLQQFNGGLLTTCGLTHVGPAEKDDITGEWRDLHGLYTRLRTHDVRVDAKSNGWSMVKDSGAFREALEKFFNKKIELSDTQADRYTLELRGSIYQSSLFGEQLWVERTIGLNLAEPSISLLDTITNMADKPVPVMLLYHINLGFPLIQNGARLYPQHENVYPRATAAKAGYSTWSQYEGAAAGYPEQVFFHHMRGFPYRDDYVFTSLLLVNDAEDFGLHLSWEAKTLPYLTQWKNTRQGIYVCGLEPGNCIPEGLNAARKNGRLTVLEPGQQIETNWGLEIIDGADCISTYKDSVSRFRRKGAPLANCHLEDYAKFAQEE